MEKMRLSLETLEVQSFATTDAEAQQRGTVHGEQATCPTVDPYDTCWASCEGTCESACYCYSQDCGTGDCNNSYGDTFLVTCCESWWGGC